MCSIALFKREDNMALNILIGLIVLVASVAALTGYYYGVFRKIKLSEREIGPYHIVYRELDGVNSKAIQEIKVSLGAELAGLGISQLVPFDIFYPKDSGVPNKIGFEISDTDFDKVSVSDIPKNGCRKKWAIHNNDLSVQGASFLPFCGYEG